MTDNEKPEVAPTKCTPVMLLLFVGFIFGFIAGYGTKDIILQSLSRVVKTDIEAIKKEPPSPGVAPSTTEAEPDKVSETPLKDEGKSKEEVKTPEENKPAEQP